MTVSVWHELAHPPARLEHDVAVVGAGLVGSYAARLLARTGRSVALLDAREVAGGASGRNAGFILAGMRHHYHEAVERFGDAAREIWGLTVENRRRMLGLCRELEVEHRPLGSVHLATSDAEVRGLARAARLLERDGFEAELRTADPLGRGFCAGLLQPGDVAMQPVELTGRLARASGATIYEHSELYELRPDPRGITVLSRRATIRASAVLLAVNGYAGLVDDYLASLIYSVRSQVLVTGPLSPLLDTMGLVEDGPFYFRQLADGRLLVGGGRIDFLADEKTTVDRVTPGVQGAIERFIGRVFPEAGPAVTRRWSGIDGFTADFVPVVGHLPGEPRIAFVGGFSGNGNSIGLIAAERAVDLLLRGVSPGILGPDRLAVTAGRTGGRI